MCRDGSLNRRGEKPLRNQLKTTPCSLSSGGRSGGVGERERLASVFIHVDRIKRVDRKTSFVRRTLEGTVCTTHYFKMYTIKVRASIRVRGEK